MYGDIIEFDGTQNIEIPISAATGEISLQDQPFFKDKEIKALEVHVVDNTSKAPQSGLSVISAAAVKAASLILKSTSGKEKFSNLPLSTLVPSYNGGLLKKLTPLEIDWVNSKLRFKGSTADNTTCLITAYYKDTN